MVIGSTGACGLTATSWCAKRGTWLRWRRRCAVSKFVKEIISSSRMCWVVGGSVAGLRACFLTCSLRRRPSARRSRPRGSSSTSPSRNSCMHMHTQRAWHATCTRTTTACCPQRTLHFCKSGGGGPPLLRRFTPRGLRTESVRPLPRTATARPACSRALVPRPLVRLRSTAHNYVQNTSALDSTVRLKSIAIGGYADDL